MLGTLKRELQQQGAFLHLAPAGEAIELRGFPGNRGLTAPARRR